MQFKPNLYIGLQACVYENELTNVFIISASGSGNALTTRLSSTQLAC